MGQISVTHLPRTFSIETILGCNLRCVECAVGNDMIDRKHGRITFDRFKIIADKVRPFCEYFYLHLWGEPMLNNDIIPIIQYVARFSRSNISTNAVTLNEGSAEALIRSGVTDLIVSIDGVSQEAYAKYRVGGKAEKAINGLRMLNEMNQRFQARVNILPQFIVFKHNQHEIEAFQEICGSLGLQPSFKAPYLRTGSKLENSDVPGLSRHIATDPGERRENMRECPNGFNVFTILLDGSVVACCYDHNRKTNFGNIFESEVLDIWDSSEYVRFRDNLRNGKASKFCMEECLLY